MLFNHFYYFYCYCYISYFHLGSLDADTPLSEESLNTTKRYCSAVITAVDIAMKAKLAPIYTSMNTDKSGKPTPNIKTEPGSSSGDTKLRDHERILVLGRPPGT
jgi:hypothetical protein